MVVATGEDEREKVSVVGTITVADGQIVVCREDKNGLSRRRCGCEYNQATIENLRDAARVLGLWLEIPHEDVALECQRVHAKDQEMAFLRETIDDTVGCERKMR